MQKLNADSNVDHSLKEAKNTVQTDFTLRVRDKKTESGINIPPRSLFEYPDWERKHMVLSLFIRSKPLFYLAPLYKVGM